MVSVLPSQSSLCCQQSRSSEQGGRPGKATGSSVGHRMDLVSSPNTVVPFANSKVELEEWREHGCLRKRKWTS